MHKPARFLKCHPRVKDGKEHRYWSICENRRTADGQRFQRQVIYLGEINDSQKANWIKQIEVFDEAKEAYATVALFPEDRVASRPSSPAIEIRLGEFEVCRPPQWGACWLGLWLWRTLKLDEFWTERLPASREGTQWRLILKALSVFRLVDPGTSFGVPTILSARCEQALTLIEPLPLTYQSTRPGATTCVLCEEQ